MSILFIAFFGAISAFMEQRAITLDQSPQWQVTPEPVAYPDALSAMEQRVDEIIAGQKGDFIWLLEHPPLYTAGTSTNKADLLDARFPVFETGRGGEYTYHGPGQRVGYVLLNLKNYGSDIRKFVWLLEEWIIQALGVLGVKGVRRKGRVGIWVEMADYGGLPGQEAKIAAIGVRVRKWVTFHGVSINLNPDLSHFGGIVPCGISDHGVTSLHALGKTCSMDELDAALKQSWDLVFTY